MATEGSPCTYTGIPAIRFVILEGDTTKIKCWSSKRNQKCSGQVYGDLANRKHWRNKGFFKSQLRATGTQLRTPRTKSG